MDLGLLERLVETPGVSGFEGPIRDLVRGLVSGLGRVWEDGQGNLFLDVGGEGDPLVFVAHLDELGLVTTHIEDNGLVAFRKVGGIDDRVLPSQAVVIYDGELRIPGVIGLTPPHLQLERDQKVVPWHSLRIDVGASSREEAIEMGVKPVQPVTFKKDLVRLAGGRILASRGFDDRAGVGVLVEAARMIAEGEVRPRGRVVFAFSLQEEVGLRGATAISISAPLRPRAAIIVDTMACCNPVITGDVKPGGGPVIRMVDNAYTADLRLAEAVREVASRRGINVQVGTAGGGTDAAAFQRAGVRSLALGIPLKYTHSTVEMLYLDDYEKTIELVAGIIEDL